MPVKTLGDLVKKYGTNLLKAPLLSMHLEVELYGRLVRITVETEGGPTEEQFEVIG